MAEAAVVPSVPCPRCGCCMTRRFECGCGTEQHDYCVNCGRFTALAPTESVELTELDARCEKGAAPHDHPWSEKAPRFEAFYGNAVRQGMN